MVSLKKTLGALIALMAIGYVINQVIKLDRESTNDWKGEKTYESERQAQSACLNWKNKAGQWKLKVTEFGISSTLEEEEDKLGPIILEKINPIPKEDPSYKKSSDEFAVKIPILSYGEANSSRKQSTSIGRRGTKWISYDTRVCRKHLIEKRLIVGEEYQVNEETLEAIIMPEIVIRKRYKY